MSRGRLYSFQSAFVRLVIWTGTCGFGRRRAEVLAQLDAVEIQETFYRPVPVERAAKWRAQGPPEVRVCGEAAPIITHEAASPTYRRAGRGISDLGEPPDRSFFDPPPVPGGLEAP